jgi:hypothetical protein
MHPAGRYEGRRGGHGRDELRAGSRLTAARRFDRNFIVAARTMSTATGSVDPYP